MAEPIRVLHVGDDPGFPEATGRSLDDGGLDLRVETAAGAGEALDRLDGEAFDCVVSDYDLPEGAGIALLEAVREEYPDLPFVLRTGCESGEVATEAIDAGATDVARKGDDDRYGVLVRRIRNAVERRRIEEDRKEKGDLLDAVFEHVPIHLYVKDEEARLLRISEHYIDDPESRIGKTDREIAPGEFGEEAYADDMQVIETGEPIINREEYLPSRERWSLTSKAPWYGDDGEIKGLVGATRVITERKEYEEELQRQNERLEEFASVVSHDLRNPLNIVQGRIELARAEENGEHLDAAADALDRSLELIENLLALAREGEQVQEMESVDLAEVVRECWLTVETGEATLDTETDLAIRADRSRLRQLLENLVGNAIEHGGTRVTVGDVAGGTGFYVADDGPGIPADERDRVFGAGYSTTEDGTGFGLNIVREIAEAHGWTVDVTEGAAGGARFEITGVDIAE